MEGHAAVVATLLAQGALVDKADNEGSAPLHAAAAMGHEAVVEKPEPWPDTWTLVSIDTRPPSTRPTLVSIDRVILRSGRALEKKSENRPRGLSGPAGGEENFLIRSNTRPFLGPTRRPAHRWKDLVERSRTESSLWQSHRPGLS